MLSHACAAVVASMGCAQSRESRRAGWCTPILLPCCMFEDMSSNCLTFRLDSTLLSAKKHIKRLYGTSQPLAGPSHPLGFNYSYATIHVSVMVMPVRTAGGGREHALEPAGRLLLQCMRLHPAGFTVLLGSHQRQMAQQGTGHDNACGEEHSGPGTFLSA